MKAPRARYRQVGTADLTVLAQAPLPLLPLFDERARRQPDPARLTPGERPWAPRASWIRQADDIHQYVRSGNERALAPLNGELAADLVLLRAALVDCKLRLPEGALRQKLGDLARFAAVHLPPAQASAFWRELTSASCEARLPAADRRWLQLHRAVAAGRAAEMADAAQAILDAEPELGGQLLAHALSAYMVGKILTRRAGDAMTAFNKHRRRLGPAARDWQPVFNLLVAQADYR
jgi:hypothetical protein